MPCVSITAHFPFSRLVPARGTQELSDPGLGPNGANSSDLLHEVALVDVIVNVIDSPRLRQRLRQR